MSHFISRGLLFRAAAFAFSWLFLPFWIFFIVAVYFYLVPLFRPKDFALPFSALILFTYTEEKSFVLAVVFAVLFYLIVGAKDLILINRQSAKEALALLFALFLSVKFFSLIDSWNRLSVLGYSLAASVLVLFLARLFIASDTMTAEDPLKKKTNVSLLVSAFFIWQLFLVIVYLPLNFLQQTAIFIVTATIFLELISDHIRSALTKRKILLQFSIFLVFITVILGSAQWAL